MKPAISADGFSTERTSREQAASDQTVLDTMLARGDVVIQRLVPEIRTDGEISMMFFGGAFSHAVSKRPQAGEFRVQERLGGRIARDRSAAAPWSIMRTRCWKRMHPAASTRGWTSW